MLRQLSRRSFSLAALSEKIYLKIYILPLIFYKQIQDKVKSSQESANFLSNDTLHNENLNSLNNSTITLFPIDSQTFISCLKYQKKTDTFHNKFFHASRATVLNLTSHLIKFFKPKAVITKEHKHSLKQNFATRFRKLNLYFQRYFSSSRSHR